MQTRYIDLDTPLFTRYLLEGSIDGEKWFVLADAIGYNVRYGIAQDKLYSSWLVYVCVDAINENGVTEGKVVKMV